MHVSVGVRLDFVRLLPYKNELYIYLALKTAFGNPRTHCAVGVRLHFLRLLSH